MPFMGSKSKWGKRDISSKCWMLTICLKLFLSLLGIWVSGLLSFSAVTLIRDTTYHPRLQPHEDKRNHMRISNQGLKPRHSKQKVLWLYHTDFWHYNSITYFKGTLEQASYLTPSVMRCYLDWKIRLPYLKEYEENIRFYYAQGMK